MANMKALLDAFLSLLLSVFPRSPFADIISQLEQLPYLGYLNWFMPVSEMLAIGSLWLVAIGVYYLWSVVARWINLIS